MTNRAGAPKDPNRSESRADTPIVHPPRRFTRTDGRFDLPVVTGRTPQQVARRLA
jgi:hypothetical protein